MPTLRFREDSEQQVDLIDELGDIGYPALEQVTGLSGRQSFSDNTFANVWVSPGQRADT